MKISNILKIFVLIILAIALIASGARAVTNITGCTTINTPGEYQFANSISTSTNPCIVINVSNVRINGQGYTFTATSSSVSQKMFQGGSPLKSLNNITIYNLTIVGTSTSEIYKPDWFYFSDGLNNSNFSYIHLLSSRRGYAFFVSGINITIDNFIADEAPETYDNYGMFIGSCNFCNLTNSIINYRNPNRDIFSDGWSNFYINNLTVKMSYSGSADIFNSLMVNGTINNSIFNYTNASIGNNAYLAYSLTNVIITNSKILYTNSTSSSYLFRELNNCSIYNNIIRLNLTNGGFLYTNINSNFNTTNKSGTNIIGTNRIGGNYWINGAGTGFSQTCISADGDEFCDTNFTVNNATDYLPLASPITSPFVTYNSNVLEYSNQTFNLSFGYIPTYVTNITANLTYGGTTYTVSGVNNSSTWNFTKTINIPAVSAAYNETKQFYWTYYVQYVNGENVTYNTSTYNQTVYKLYFSTTQPTPYVAVYNITYKDEATGAPITGVTNVWQATAYTLYNTSATREYQGTTTGNFTTFYAVWANASNTFQVDATMKLSATGYSTRYFSLDNFTVNGTMISQTIYLLSSSSSQQIIISVTDQDSDPLPDVLIKVYRENVGYVFSITTDSQGKAVTNLDTTAKYRFVLYYNGEQVHDSGYIWITSTTISFQINLEKYNIIDILLAFKNMEHDLFYSNGTFTLTYNDVNRIAREVCLEVIQENITNASVPIGTNCSTASSGTLTITLTQTQGMFVAVAYGYSSGGDTTNKYFIDMIIQDNRTFENIFGKEMGLFVAFLVVGTVAFLGLFNPVASIIFALSALLGSIILGLVNVSYAAMIGLIVVAIILIIKLRT